MINIMKKLTANFGAISVLFALLLLSSCSQDNSHDQEPIAEEATSVAQEQTKIIEASESSEQLTEIEEVSETQQELIEQETSIIDETTQIETTKKDAMIKLVTSAGTIAIELDFEKAPLSAENFKKYCEDGFYEGTIFHRVIDNFMIQGGGMNADMQEKPNGEPIENEADNGLKNDRGTLAMARTNDPHSATSQFFINVKDNDFLNHTGKNPQGWGYAVFGKVAEGMDIVDKIKGVETGNAGFHQDVPLEPIVIEKCEIVE